MHRTLVAPVSFGLGDLVVSLPAIQAVIKDEAAVWLVARAPSQRLLAERIPGLAGVVDEADAVCGPGDRLIDLRDHPLQRDFWWGSPAFEAEFGGLDINDILHRICTDHGINADFSRPVPLDAYPRADLERTVLLVHETDGADKSWPVDHWAAVVGILRAEGQDVAQVVKENGPSPLNGLGVPSVVVPTPPDAVDVLSACLGVIGVDTGLTHIAAQQSTPTVTICRRSSVYVRAWPHCAALRGTKCTDQCIDDEMSYAYNQTVSLREFRPSPRRCPSGAPCLANTRPADAVTLLRGVL
ncbi:MAG TPA: glycosyltransferase family 9 protein [Acidimicrobiales bacterium]|nr:glycosyltransferase family 9 protein [Acidimicrobiales bacterium]